MSFHGDTRRWQAYQHDWLRTFAPSTTLAPEGDSRRRPQWTAVVRQWKAIDAAREKEVSRYVEVGAAASAASSTAASADAASAELANGAGRSLCASNAVPPMDGSQASSSSSIPAVPRQSARLRAHVSVQPSWLQQNAPNIQGLAMGTPHLTPSGMHAERELRASVLTPAGHDQAGYSEALSYSLPPLGEAQEEARLREVRQDKRERDALERMNAAPTRDAALAEVVARRAIEAAVDRDAIERRKAAVRRDGRTLYHTQSYRLVNPLTRTHNSHDACVFYPDGARCMVMRPFVWDASVPGRPATNLSL